MVQCTNGSLFASEIFKGLIFRGACDCSEFYNGRLQLKGACISNLVSDFLDRFFVPLNELILCM